MALPVARGLAAAESAFAGRFVSREAGALARTGGKVAGIGAGATGLYMGGRMLQGVMGGHNPSAQNTPANDTGGGNFGKSAPASSPGASSARGFSPPTTDNNFKRFTANLNGDVEQEQLKAAIAQTNTLSSIDNILKNILKFNIAKANHDAKSLEEFSLERQGANSGGYSSPAGGAGAMSGNRESARGMGAMLAAAAGIAGLIALAKGFFSSGGTGPSAPGVGPSTAFGKIGQAVGDGLLAGSYAGDARRAIGARGAARGIASANDNFRPVTRATSALGRVTGVGRRLVGFFRGIKASPFARLPWVTTIFASIDPVLAYIDAGGQVDENVKKQLVGAIAMVLAGPGGVAAGAAIGGAIGSVVPGAGTIAGIIAGGILGAAASIGAEFVAEQLYDLVTGKISKGEFVNRVFRGAVSGVGRVPGMAAGAVIGAAVGARAAIGSLAGRGAARGAAVSSATASVRAGSPMAARAGLTVRAPTIREGIGAAAGAGAIGVGAAMSSPPGGTQSPRSNPEGATGDAKTYAQNYLGRVMTDREWHTLIKATYAESGNGAAGREDAMIMASILNRARNYRQWVGKPNGRVRSFLSSGETVLAVLYANNQFQAVTGTSVNGRRPSAMFTNGPSARRLGLMMEAIVAYLWKVPTSQVSFTAADPRAYGPGTNIGELHRRLGGPGASVVGGTAFNTTMSGTSGQRIPSVAPIASGGGGASAPAPSGGGAVSPAPSGGVLNRFAGALGNFGRAAGAAIGGSVAATVGGAASAGMETAGNVAATVGGWIIPAAGTILSRMGHRQAGNHKGIDIAAPAGSPIYAANGGRVVRAERSNSYGNVVYIDHGGGLQSRYAHMSSIGVQNGQEVAAGSQIGRVGNTGRSRGNHLHFEILRNGAQINPESMVSGLRSRVVATPPPVAPRGTMSPAGSPAARTAAITASTMAMQERQQTVVVQQPESRGQAKAQTQTRKTDSGAPESVSSPVSSAYAYASYWGVGA